MSAGVLLLTITAVLVYCGLLQRVLDRMYLTDRQALAMIAAMFIGTFLPNIVVGTVTIGIGGALIPTIICIYLLIRASESIERLRALIGSLLTAAAITAATYFLPVEAERMPIDPMWLYGICGGLIAWVTSRSRRSAFICGVGGVILADIVNAATQWLQGLQVELVLGGAGIADAAVISGVMSVLVCELLGEAVERVTRHQMKKGGHA